MTQPPRIVVLLLLLFPGWATAWIPGLTTPAAVSSKNKPPIVICPGFGNDQIDYLSPMNLGEEASFAQALRRRGFPVFVVSGWVAWLGWFCLSSLSCGVCLIYTPNSHIT